MPIYEFSCPSCDLYSERFFGIKERPTTIQCSHCGAQMRRAFTKVNLSGHTSDYARKRFPYFDEPLGRRFDSHQEKTDYLKKHNIRIREPGEAPIGVRLKSETGTDGVVLHNDSEPTKDQLQKTVHELKQRRGSWQKR